MKKLLAFFLALLTVVSMVPAVSAAPTTGDQGIAPIAETLPSSYSLVDNNQNGTLPPIDDQGQIGSCVGQAVTYMQFTNAVARYMQNKGQTTWKPNDGSKYGNDAYIFSPKWTLNYSGAGTQWVYDIILHMGVPTQTLSKFYKYTTNTTNSSRYYSGSSGGIKNYYKETTSWDVTEKNGVDIMETALNYRMSKYEQIWTKDVGGGQITTTEKGKELINKIKASIKAGNVVVTGGPSGKWGYKSQTNSIGQLSGKGDIGKVGEYCCFAAQGSGAGGHQVSIVGWDDNVTYRTKNGVTMTGAFLVANSWATSWMNGGYMWFMYDSINKTSQYATQDSSLNLDTRDYSLDQFCFTDWHDVEVGQPELTVSAEITTKNREGTSLLLTRTDPETGTTVTYQPKIFYYGDLGVHETYDLKAPHYFNYKGEVDGDEATAHFAFSYENIYDSMAKDKSISDYVWGFQVVVDKGNVAKVGEVELKSNVGGETSKSIFKKKFDVTVDGTDYDTKAYIACDNQNYILPDSSNMFTVTPAKGSASPVTSGGSYSFTVTPTTGYTLAYATVLANGKPLSPDADGVYTIPNIQSSAIISVPGIVEDVSYKKFSPVMYNSDGWEYWGNEYLMVVQIGSTVLRRDLYADTSKIGTENYPYWFRLTDQATNTSYYMQPSSIYDFGGNGSILYRLPFLDAGFSATEDQTYKFTVDVLYEGHVLYTGTMSTTCHFADDNADTSKKPPQKNNTTVAPSGKVHTVTYTYNGKTLGKDAFVEGSKIVNRVATSNTEYEAVYATPLPETMGKNDIKATVIGTAYSRGDITDDGVVNAKDLSRLCLYLGKDTTVCNKELADANGDGKIQIDDLTYLLGKFSAPVSIVE